MPVNVHPLSLVAAFALGAAAPAPAAMTVRGAEPQGAAPRPIGPALAADYVGPHQLVDIGGRKLNLFCMGRGKTTVLFDAGGSDWSVIWALVQPAVAGHARACSYDRAGLGHSDSDPGPRTPFAIADDLHKLVGAASLDRPLVLVGHSLGGFNMKLYGVLFPEDVSGMVLIDPSEERDGERTRDFMTEGWGASVAAQNELAGHRFRTRLVDHYRDCAEAADKAPLDPAGTLYRRCTDPARPALGPIIAAKRSELQRAAKYQRAQSSEIAYSVYGDARADAVYAKLFRRGVLGSRPLIVLTSPVDDGPGPLEKADAASTARLQEETARLSTSGCHEQVERTGHNIQIDRPDAVIAAILRVVELVEGKGRPAPDGAGPRCGKAD